MFNSSIFILLLALFIDRLCWTVPDTIYGNFSKIEFMIANNILLLWILLFFLYKIQNLYVEVRLFLKPEKVLERNMMDRHKSIKMVTSICHNLFLLMFLIVKPTTWLLIRIGIKSVISLTPYKQHVKEHY